MKTPSSQEKSMPALDLTKWYGPLLLLKVKNFTDQLLPGQMAQLAIRPGEPGKELETLLQVTGYRLIESFEAPGNQVILIRRETPPWTEAKYGQGRDESVVADKDAVLTQKAELKKPSST